MSFRFSSALSIRNDTCMLVTVGWEQGRGGDARKDRGHWCPGSEEEQGTAAHSRACLEHAHGQSSLTGCSPGVAQSQTR